MKMKMYPKPKSAPASTPSKFMTNKSNAVKEIEAWVKKDADPLSANFEASRMSGQLVDNVTEERMLKAKLWELSKERYKFLSQTAYEKKIFIDRIQRKSSAIGRVIAQSEAGSSRRPSLEQSEVSFSSSQTTKSSNARQAFLNRMDPKRKRDRPKELRISEEKVRNKKVSFPRNLVTEMTITSRLSDSKICDSPIVSKAPSLPNVVTAAAVVASASTSLLDGIGKEPEGFKTWAQKRPMRRFGATPQSIVTDPRYSHLEHALCPVKNFQTTTDLRTVVHNLDCLHLPPKVTKEARKPKTGLKAMEFMKERGFVF